MPRVARKNGFGSSHRLSGTGPHPVSGKHVQTKKIRRPKSVVTETDDLLESRL
jgi:hypothetical protein